MEANGSKWKQMEESGRIWKEMEDHGWKWKGVQGNGNNNKTFEEEKWLKKNKVERKKNKRKL